MHERELRNLIADVKTGQLSRRAFVQRMIAVGLTAPMAGMMLAQSGVPMQAAEIPYKPTKAGGGGLLKILYWQAVTLLNPHFAVGTKDQDGSRIFYEPLAGWDGDGNLVPVLAAEIPSKENDGLAEDGRSVVCLPCRPRARNESEFVKGSALPSMCPSCRTFLLDA